MYYMFYEWHLTPDLSNVNITNVIILCSCFEVHVITIGTAHLKAYLAWHYLSKATCLVRPPLFSTALLV